MNDWKPVAKALLGAWPSQINAWGDTTLAAYLSEIEARGVTPEQALVALRSCAAEQKFPPSAPELAGLAHRDPSRPTFDEVVVLLYGKGGVMLARGGYEPGQRDREQRDAEAQLDRARSMHPAVFAFVTAAGLGRLRSLAPDGEWGEANRKRLRVAWDEFCATGEQRTVAGVARGGRRGELGAFDPAGSLRQAGVRPPRREIER